MASTTPQLSHVIEGLPFPSTHPPGYEVCSDEVDTWDSSVHLNIEPPPWVRPLLRTNDDTGPQDFPLPIKPNDSSFPGLAFSAPFQLLSDEGLAAFQRSVSQNEHHAHTTGRQPKALRGLGYRSEFARSLAHDPSVLGFLSSLTGKQIWPEDHSTNNPQINFGAVGSGVPVDRWHLDSVPFVLVLVLSELEDMVGGELKVARMADAKECLDLLKEDNLPESKIDTVKYPKAGWAIFMQGSKIAHMVTPVQSAKEPRRTAVYSFQTRDCFAPDDYVFRTFKNTDQATLHTEHTRHVAWRARGQLSYLLGAPRWGQGNEDRELTLKVVWFLSL